MVKRAQRAARPAGAVDAPAAAVCIPVRRASRHLVPHQARRVDGKVAVDQLRHLNRPHGRGCVDHPQSS